MEICNNIADYVSAEPEDPPEPVKTAMALVNERNPLHKLEERLDTKHLINHSNWGIYFTTDEYWHFELPFRRELLQMEEPSNDYEHEACEYNPDISDLPNPILLYSPITYMGQQETVIEVKSEEIGDTIVHSESLLDWVTAMEIELIILQLLDNHRLGAEL